MENNSDSRNRLQGYRYDMSNAPVNEGNKNYAKAFCSQRQKSQIDKMQLEIYASLQGCKQYQGLSHYVANSFGAYIQTAQNAKNWLLLVV